MGAERVKCRSEGCGNRILVATAAANDGYCAPCVAKQRQAERDEYIRLNRRTVDPYAGVTDRVEVVRILHSRRDYDPLIQWAGPPKRVEELYGSLTPEEIARLKAMATKALRDGNQEFAEDVAKSLATLTDANLDDMARYVGCGKPLLAFNYLSQRRSIGKRSHCRCH